eukprot:4740520-Lingulodinium_polyedra.AAC.1
MQVVCRFVGTGACACDVLPASVEVGVACGHESLALAGLVQLLCACVVHGSADPVGMLAAPSLLGPRPIGLVASRPLACAPGMSLLWAEELAALAQASV